MKRHLKHATIVGTETAAMVTAGTIFASVVGMRVMSRVASRARGNVTRFLRRGERVS